MAAAKPIPLRSPHLNGKVERTQRAHLEANPGRHPLFRDTLKARRCSAAVHAVFFSLMHSLSFSSLAGRNASRAIAL